MHETMKATWRTEVSRLSGERYVCDVCKKVILDTTQIEEKFINQEEKVPYFSIHEGAKRYDACSPACVQKLFNDWNSRPVDRSSCAIDEQRTYIFNVSEQYINVNTILNRYSCNEQTVSKKMTINEWNDIKMKNSSPAKSSE